MSFDGRVALITGGSQGLGYATAALLKEKGAAGLMLVGRDLDKGLAAAASLAGDDCRVEFASVDLSDPDGPAAAVAATDASWLSDLPDGGVRELFAHLAAHGAVDKEGEDGGNK